MELRDYQQECINMINNLKGGSYLIQLPTGTGKTFIFTHIQRKGRVLVLAHREELISQPIKYYDCPVGIEMAERTSNNEEVVIASVQSLIRRLGNFNKNDFDMIITDEAHHAAAASYKKIYKYFKCRLHLGFTATPNRGDKVRLDDVFKEIIFQRDIKWAIKSKHLSNIYCLRVNIGYDLSKVKRHMGDFENKQLENALNIDELNKAIAEVYYKHAKGQTLIFATSVKHADAIAKEITGAISVTANTKNRDEIIKKFMNKEIPVLVNCMLFTEGTDIPVIETIIIARPTQNSSLYTQMVGRGLRLYPNKDRLVLIDCVGVTGKNDICTAPSLLGIDLQTVPRKLLDEIEGDLLSLPDIILKKSDSPESWIQNVELVDIWAKEQHYNTYNMNLFKMPNGDLILSTGNAKLKIPAQDELGRVELSDKSLVPMQKALDLLYKTLNRDYKAQQVLWDLNICRKWGGQVASEKQLEIINNKFKDFDTTNLTKFEASQIINRMFAK